MSDTVLAEVIRQRGSRQTYLAECAGVTPSHLNRALRLERPLSAEAVKVIAERLGVSFDDVYDGRQLRTRTDTTADAQNAPPDGHGQQGGVKVDGIDTSASPGENGLSAASQREIA